MKSMVTEHEFKIKVKIVSDDFSIEREVARKLIADRLDFFVPNDMIHIKAKLVD